MEKDGWDLSAVSPGFIENLPETHKFVMNKIDYKKRIHFGEDVFALTMMCLLKETVEKHKVVPEKQGQMIYQSLTIAIVQFLLIAAVFYAVTTNEGGEYSNTFQPSLMLFYVKMPCSVALHFFLFPRAQTGMNMMKFANNNPGLFVDWGAVGVTYTLGLIQFLTSLAVEYVNVNILAYQTSIESSIIYFVMLHNLSEVAEIYFHAQHHKNPIAKCMEI